MEMKLLIPSPAVDFKFGSTSNSPYVTAPSSPQRLGNYFFSAPTSPTRSSAFAGGDTSPSNTPFNWEEKPGVPKRSVDTEFAFDLQLERASVPADELFDDGVIKPLRPPPRFQYTDSPKSPKRLLRETFFKKKEVDPFSAAFQQTLGGNGTESHINEDEEGLHWPRYSESPKSPKSMFREAFLKKKEIDSFSAAFQQTSDVHTETEQQANDRGRQRTQSSSNSNNTHKGSRSLSPLRISDMLFDHQNETNPQSSKQSSSSVSTWYNRWKLKDLLFRSKSEGSARNGKDPLRKYSLLKKNESEDVKNPSFRSSENGGGSGGSELKRKGNVSAHELHYTANRAVAEEMKRKTYLPYKRGLLGCLRFNSTPVVVHEISRGFGIN